MNKRYIAVFLLVIVVGIVAQNAIAAFPNANKDANIDLNANNSSTVSASTGQNANVNPFANGPSANMGPSTSVGSSISTSTVTEQAKTKIIQFVDSPYSVTYGVGGVAEVKLVPSGFLSVDGYRQVCTQILSTNSNTTSFDIYMGYVGKHNALAYRVANNVPVDAIFPNAAIHCYSVDGPIIDLVLHGNPSTNDKVQLWVYLRS
jgi:hypothetical protein